MGVWIDAGSRYETEKNNGAGYFLEHLAFKVSLVKSMIPLSVDRLSQKTRVQKISLLIVELLGHNRWLCFWEGAVWA